jgi:tripartite-type tricarboxylate transporter receptor subunit TctC
VQRITFLRAIASLAALSCLGTADAQNSNYPDKTIRLILPWPAGGITDVVGRVIARQVGLELGKTIVVDNRPGASGVIGTEAAMRAAPDGYTLYLGNGASMSVMAAVDPKLSYDPQKDFAPIALLSDSPAALLTRANLPANNLKEFIALAKAQPGKLTFASPGTGSTFHLLAELFKAQAGISALHIPFQGSSPATNAVISGTVDFQIDATGKQYVDAHQMKALAVTGTKRWFLMPDVPTFAESGITGLEKGGWSGLFAPAGTPAAIIQKLNAAVNAAVKRPEVTKTLALNGFSALGGSSNDLRDYLSADLARWKKVVADNPSMLKTQ